METGRMVKDFRVHGGSHCETTAANHVLRHAGVSLSEQMLLGLGGGIGFIYWYMKRMPSPLVGGRAGGRDLNLVANILSRTGGRCEILTTTSASKAEGWLREELDAGYPVICWGDMAYLPWFGDPDAHFGGHVFVVYGLDDATDTVWVADRGLHPCRLTREELRLSRSSPYQPFPPRNMTARARPSVPPADLTPSILTAIRECARGLGDAPISNIGVRGVERWAAEVLTWPASFPGARLVDCLSSVYLYIELGGTGGSAFRTMYAAFLREAARITGVRGLVDTAEAYTRCAAVWSEIAAAALPDQVPELAALRAAMDERGRIMEHNDGDPSKRTREANRVLAELRPGAAAALTPQRSRELTEGLSAHIHRLHALEAEALALLNAAVPA